MLQSSSSENNLVNCFGSNFHKKGVLIMGCTQNENNFFGRNNKNRSSAFGNFLFYHNNICFSWVMNLFLSWVIFFVKKCHFQLKQLMDSTTNAVASFTDLKHQRVFLLDFLHIIHTIIYNGKKKMFSQWNEILS